MKGIFSFAKKTLIQKLQKNSFVSMILQKLPNDKNNWLLFIFKFYVFWLSVYKYNGKVNFLRFNMFIRSSHLYKYKFKEKTINNDKCLIQLWLMPLLGLLMFLVTVVCSVFKMLKSSWGHLYVFFEKKANFWGNKTVNQHSGANLKKHFFFQNFAANFLLFCRKTLKMTISTSVWRAQHPNAGRIMQHIIILQFKF